jgi:hypothetical protein
MKYIFNEEIDRFINERDIVKYDIHSAKHYDRNQIVYIVNDQELFFYQLNDRNYCHEYPSVSNGWQLIRRETINFQPLLSSSLSSLSNDTYPKNKKNQIKNCKKINPAYTPSQPEIKRCIKYTKIRHNHEIVQNPHIHSNCNNNHHNNNHHNNNHHNNNHHNNLSDEEIYFCRQNERRHPNSTCVKFDCYNIDPVHKPVPCTDSSNSSSYQLTCDKSSSYPSSYPSNQLSCEKSSSSESSDIPIVYDDINRYNKLSKDDILCFECTTHQYPNSNGSCSNQKKVANISIGNCYDLDTLVIGNNDKNESKNNDSVLILGGDHNKVSNSKNTTIINGDHNKVCDIKNTISLNSQNSTLKNSDTVYFFTRKNDICEQFSHWESLYQNYFVLNNRDIENTFPLSTNGKKPSKHNILVIEGSAHIKCEFYSFIQQCHKSNDLFTSVESFHFWVYHNPQSRSNEIVDITQNQNCHSQSHIIKDIQYSDKISAKLMFQIDEKNRFLVSISFCNCRKILNYDDVVVKNYLSIDTKSITTNH